MGTLIVGGILLLVVVLIVRGIIRDKKAESIPVAVTAAIAGAVIDNRQLRLRNR